MSLRAITIAGSLVSNVVVGGAYHMIAFHIPLLRQICLINQMKAFFLSMVTQMFLGLLYCPQREWRLSAVKIFEFLTPYLLISGLIRCYNHGPFLRPSFKTAFLYSSLILGTMQLLCNQLIQLLVGPAQLLCNQLMQLLVGPMQFLVGPMQRLVDIMRGIVNIMQGIVDNIQLLRNRLQQSYYTTMQTLQSFGPRITFLDRGTPLLDLLNLEVDVDEPLPLHDPDASPASSQEEDVEFSADSPLHKDPEPSPASSFLQDSASASPVSPIDDELSDTAPNPGEGVVSRPPSPESHPSLYASQEGVELPDPQSPHEDDAAGPLDDELSDAASNPGEGSVSRTRPPESHPSLSLSREDVKLTAATPPPHEGAAEPLDDKLSDAALELPDPQSPHEDDAAGPPAAELSDADSDPGEDVVSRTHPPEFHPSLPLSQEGVKLTAATPSPHEGAAGPPAAELSDADSDPGEDVVTLSPIPESIVLPPHSHAASECPRRITTLREGSTQQLFVFGQEEWSQHIGSIPEEEALSPPKEMLDALGSPCPFFDNMLVAQSHICVLMPKKLNNKPLTWGSLQSYLQAKNFIITPPQQKLLDVSIEKSYWFIITKEALPCSNKEYDSDPLKLEPPQEGYRLPNMLEAVVSIVLYFLQTRENLFKDSYTYCGDNELAAKKSLIVGDLSEIESRGNFLGVFHQRTCNPRSVGMTAVREFTGDGEQLQSQNR